MPHRHLFRNAHDRGSLPKPLTVVCRLPLQGGGGGPTSLYPPSLLVLPWHTYVAHPGLVQAVGAEVAVELVGRHGLLVVGLGRNDVTASSLGPESAFGHEATNTVPADARFVGLALAALVQFCDLASRTVALLVFLVDCRHLLELCAPVCS